MNTGGTQFKKGHVQSLEIRNKISEAHKGKKFSIEHKKKLSIAKIGSIPWNKGIKLPKEKKGVNHPLYGKKQSIEHRSKLSKAQTGKKGKDSSHWKGGITLPNQKLRGSLEYKLWRKSVFERDNFICQKTGVSGGALEVHHINNFADFPELRLAIDNGVTLSKKTHKEFHKIYGRKNNTKEQLDEFLNN